MAPDEVSAVVHGLLEAWNTRDLPRFLGYLTEDVEWYDPAMPHPPARGREAVRRFSEAVLRAFPDFEYSIRPPLCFAADGSRCVVLWHIAATQTGVLDPPGFAPTHRRVSIDGVDVLEFRGGLVCRILTAFDVLAATDQLLAVHLRPPPGSWRERVAVVLQRLLAARARRQPPLPAFEVQHRTSSSVDARARAAEAHDVRRYQS